jgi:hypothetical protein
MGFRVQGYGLWFRESVLLGVARGLRRDWELVALINRVPRWPPVLAAWSPACVVFARECARLDSFLDNHHKRIRE